MSIDHNMEVYCQVKKRLQAPAPARKLDITRFGFSVVRTDGWMGVRSVGHVINKISRIERLPTFVRNGFRSRART